jgi:hypothetical protein
MFLTKFFKKRNKQHIKNFLLLPLKSERAQISCNSWKSNNFRDSYQEKKQRTETKKNAKNIKSKKYKGQNCYQNIGKNNYFALWRNQ